MSLELLLIYELLFETVPESRSKMEIGLGGGFRFLQVHSPMPVRKFPFDLAIVLPRNNHTTITTASSKPIMSTVSKVTLLGTTVATAGIIVFVHWAQTQEKAVRENKIFVTSG